jgi:general secretion pathway protein K
LLIDWMDRDTNVLQDGGEDSLYASRTPPHRTGNFMLTSISELQQLPDFNRELYLRLAPFITALPPTANTINVCTAEREVLDALYAVSTNPQLKNYIEYTRMTPEDLAANRKQACFPSKSVHSQNDGDVGRLTAETSSYFRLHTWVRIGTSQFALYSLMYRDGSSKARPIMRTFGTE